MIAESGSPYLLSVDSPARAEKRGSGWIERSPRKNRHLVRIGLSTTTLRERRRHPTVPAPGGSRTGARSLVDCVPAA